MSKDDTFHLESIAGQFDTHQRPLLVISCDYLHNGACATRVRHIPTEKDGKAQMYTLVIDPSGHDNFLPPRLHNHYYHHSSGKRSYVDSEFRVELADSGKSIELPSVGGHVEYKRRNVHYEVEPLIILGIDLLTQFSSYTCYDAEKLEFTLQTNQYANNHVEGMRDLICVIGLLPLFAAFFLFTNLESFRLLYFIGTTEGTRAPLKYGHYITIIELGIVVVASVVVPLIVYPILDPSHISAFWISVAFISTQGIGLLYVIGTDHPSPLDRCNSLTYLHVKTSRGRLVLRTAFSTLLALAGLTLTTVAWPDIPMVILLSAIFIFLALSLGIYYATITIILLNTRRRPRGYSQWVVGAFVESTFVLLYLIYMVPFTITQFINAENATYSQDIVYIALFSIIALAAIAAILLLQTENDDVIASNQADEVKPKKT